VELSHELRSIAFSPAYTALLLFSLGRIMSNPASYDSHRRSTVFSRQPEELHIPSTGPINPNLSRQSSSHDYPATPDVGARLPAINVQSSPQHGGDGNHSSSALPGALQPGNRPPVVSLNSAPSVVPTMPQSSSQTTNHRASMINSHGHSRSSPAGFDQSMYKQHGGSDGSKYPSSPGGFPSHTPQGSKYSPLGLSDIRPSGEHLLSEALLNPGTSSVPYNHGDNQVPTNSNYVAPWPIYAVDWCKWPIAGSSGFGGKLAMGSYLEDNHNFVRDRPSK